jgi:hypothetical protein
MEQTMSQDLGQNDPSNPQQEQSAGEQPDQQSAKSQALARFQSSLPSADPREQRFLLPERQKPRQDLQDDLHQIRNKKFSFELGDQAPPGLIPGAAATRLRLSRPEDNPVEPEG